MKKPLPIHRLYIRLLLLLLAITLHTALTAQIKFGNSYVNLTKKTIGGNIEPGDSLEIRTNIWFSNDYNSGTIYSARYVDNVPAKTTFADVSLRLITNEGLTYKTFTLAPSDDPGTYNAAPTGSQYNVKINLGRYATAPTSTLNDAVGAYNIITGTSGGTKDKPIAGGGVLITTSFKVKVTGNVGDTIILGAGKIYYKTSSGGSDQSKSATQYKILISNSSPICSNAVGRNFVGEAGGTFDSGTVQNRVVAPTSIPGYVYIANMSSGNQIYDGNFAIVNNLSPTASTYQLAQKKNNCSIASGSSACSNRMFTGYWDIIGDHTGSTTSAGNPPVAPGTRGGYMLAVNADYATSEAYRQTISGLCPNTSYEFSLWVKNICTNCGMDSTGTSKYNPGVYPNLAFSIDGLDRYTSGQVDTLGWIKKGFLFKTDMAQSSITISIRNNASGGGGNDWAIDDIALVSCNPNLNMVPSGNSQVCIGSQLDIHTTVTAFFKNYNYFRWEKSTNGGATWTVPATGTGSPDPTTGVYIAPMTPASIIASASDHLNQYRFIVATTSANLNDPNCSFRDSSKIIIMVNNCNNVLSTAVTLQGKLVSGRANLKWISENEEPGVVYEIERSDDGRLYYRVGQVTGSAGGTDKRDYSFNDPGLINGNVYYRIKIIEGGKYIYTKTILLGNVSEPGIQSLVNPFVDKVSFDILAPGETQANITLIDNYGKTLRRLTTRASKGLTPFVIDGLDVLSKGVYVLRVEIDTKVINRILVKSK